MNNNTELNLHILDVLSTYLKNNPNIRFCQALCNLNINTRIVKGVTVDNYYDTNSQVIDRLDHDFID